MNDLFLILITAGGIWGTFCFGTWANEVELQASRQREHALREALREAIWDLRTGDAASAERGLRMALGDFKQPAHTDGGGS